VTVEYGSLLAQVIPVVALAILFELRALIALSNKLEESQSNASDDTSGQAKRLILGRRTVVGNLVIFGALLVMLAQGEAAALLAAQGRTVPHFEAALATATVVDSFLFVTVNPFVFEIYVQVGRRGSWILAGVYWSLLVLVAVGVWAVLIG
jgi:hypothetical protein